MKIQTTVVNYSNSVVIIRICYHFCKIKVQLTMAKIIKEIIISIRSIFTEQKCSIDSSSIGLNDLHYRGIEEDKKNMRGDFSMFASTFRNAVKERQEIMANRR